MITRLTPSLSRTSQFLHLFPPTHKFSTLTQFDNNNNNNKPLFSNQILLQKLQNSLKNNQISESLQVFNDFKSLHGFPSNQIIQKLISQLSYSSDSLCLKKGYSLLLSIHKHKPHLLHYDFFPKLVLSLARAQMPTLASTLLRIMLDLRKFPPMDLWKNVFLHMTNTDIGTYLASDLLVEIADCYMRHVEDHGTKNVKHLKLVKLDTLVFNLVLDGCVRFRSSLRAEQIVELMAVMGVTADANTVVLIAQIHEMNGQRDELRKLKDFVVKVPARLLKHYRQFYDSLLSLHLKFHDIHSAADLVLDMYKHQGSLFSSEGILLPKDGEDLPKPFLHTIGSRNLRTGLKLQIEPELLQMDFVLSVGSHPELVSYSDGRLIPSDKALALLIHGFHRHGVVGELSKLLVCIRKESNVMQNSDLFSDVLSACIRIRWLQTAHDILDDMQSDGFPMEFGAYMSLLIAYCKENMLSEAKVLIKQMRKRGWFLGLSNEYIISECFLEKSLVACRDERTASLGVKSHLADSLLEKMRENEKSMSYLVYEINSSIYFFCKGNMMDDAMKTYHRMQERNIQPTVQTFAYLVNGYSKLRMYRDITILWGEIRRKIDNGDLSATRDLHEMLLWNFIQGGYFERVLEVIEYMKRNGMYTDKWKYKREFLKLHKYLYRSLKAEYAKTEAQRKRLEHVRAFRKWVGID